MCLQYCKQQPCVNNWQKTCYIQECRNDTWTTWSARDSCSEHGAGPFKIHFDINDIAKEGSFVAVDDGREVSWTKWYPNDAHGEDAVEILSWSQSKLLNDLSGTQSKKIRFFTDI